VKMRNPGRLGVDNPASIVCNRHYAVVGPCLRGCNSNGEAVGRFPAGVAKAGSLRLLLQGPSSSTVLPVSRSESAAVAVLLVASCSGLCRGFAGASPLLSLFPPYVVGRERRERGGGGERCWSGCCPRLECDGGAYELS
jgi:hypothetical protein